MGWGMLKHYIEIPLDRGRKEPSNGGDLMDDGHLVLSGPASSELVVA